MEPTDSSCSGCGSERSLFNLVCVQSVDENTGNYIFFIRHVCKICLMLTESYCEIHNVAHTVMIQPEGQNHTHTCSHCIKNSIEKMPDEYVDRLFTILRTINPKYIKKILGYTSNGKESIKDKRNTLTSLSLLAALEGLTLEQTLSYLVEGRIDSTLQ